MQEACMWAVRGVAMDPANQHPTQPGSEATESQLDRAPTEQTNELPEV
jgi:hypothetical protein